jgi:hypothetical protein
MDLCSKFHFHGSDLTAPKIDLAFDPYSFFPAHTGRTEPFRWEKERWSRKRYIISKATMVQKYLMSISVWMTWSVFFSVKASLQIKHFFLEHCRRLNIRSWAMSLCYQWVASLTHLLEKKSYLPHIPICQGFISVTNMGAPHGGEGERERDQHPWGLWPKLVRFVNFLSLSCSTVTFATMPSPANNVAIVYINPSYHVMIGHDKVRQCMDV